MTDLAFVDTLTLTEPNRTANEGSASMPRDLEETRRTADSRSPLTNDYDLPEVMNEVLGRESAICEACQEAVHHPKGGDLDGGEPFVLREIVENVYTLENQVLLCHTCANRPSDAWRADVRAKRAQERDSPLSWTDHLAHWVSDPTATSLFARRVAAVVLGVVAIVGLLGVVAVIVGGLIGGVTTGVTWGNTVIETAVAAGSAFTASPWVAGGVVGVAYAAHAIERVHYDPRGYLPREHPPWKLLTLSGAAAGVGALGLLGVAMALLPATSLVYLSIATLWAIGAAGVAWYIDLALRHDLYNRIWSPNRGLWMIAGRVGILPGLLAITVGVPFAGVLAATTPAVFAAIPAGIAFAFAGLRLPYDTETRDRILAVLPDWPTRRRWD